MSITHKIGWLVVNLLLFSASCLMLSGCMTYQKALRKYGTMATDSATILVRDTVTIPKDSVTYSFVNDTTTFTKVVNGIRAKLKINRTSRTTSIQAECKPDTIIRQIPAKCPPVATFGVAPWYKTGFYILIGIIVAMLLAYLFSYLFKLSLSITRR